MADTYAFLAHLDDAAPFRSYMEGDVCTTAMNALEVASALLRRGHGQVLDDVLSPLLDLVVEPGPEVVAEAARFKQARYRAGAPCSYIDAWGYATAQWLGVPFLTGDEDFRGVPGVEFVKA